jgi:VIT1/CCC1 family predicted Fe2+/Mn2+ transporter/rubrerythrin
MSTDRGPRHEAGKTDEAARRLLAAWRGEIEARYTYEVIADRERDPRRAEIIRRIAEGEAAHRARIEARLRELGMPIPNPAGVRISPWLRLQARVAPIDRLLRAREAAEEDEVAGQYGTPTGDTATDAVLREIRRDEQAHSLALRDMMTGPSSGPSAETAAIQSRLDRLLSRETHRTGAGWVSDAIYGANDGLAAVFGIVAGVSGATGATEKSVLTAGLAGAVASALSMGVGAWLAARSTAEIAQASIAQERRELQEHPSEEREELSLFYQLKGLSKEEADDLVDKLARNPDAMLKSLIAEEFGGLDEGGNPWTAGIAGLISTGIGAIVPVLPFFFVGGTLGLVIAFAISLIAHFGVGAAKSLFTLRSWWSSGLEMTAAGIIVGGGTFALGLLFKVGT